MNKNWYIKNQDRIKKYKHNWYIKNKEKIKERRKKWYQDNKEKELERNNKYKKDNIIEVRKLWIKNSKDYRKKYPEKGKAHIISKNIKIPFGKLCEICNINLAKHKHHQDYSKPLAVQFLCVQCHNDVHNNKVHILMHDNLGGNYYRNV